MADTETRLEIAKQHVLVAVVEQQKQLIERRKKCGLGTASAEPLLRSYKRALATFEDELASKLHG
jgi:hypothetical protein